MIPIAADTWFMSCPPFWHSFNEFKLNSIMFKIWLTIHLNNIPLRVFQGDMKAAFVNVPYLVDDKYMHYPTFYTSRSVILSYMMIEGSITAILRP